MVLTLGISGKTQEIYLALFIFRYLDVFTNFISLYNTIMKVYCASPSYPTESVLNHKMPILSILYVCSFFLSPPLHTSCT